MSQFMLNAASMSQMQYNLNAQYSSIANQVISSFQSIHNAINTAKGTMNAKYEEVLKEWEQQVQQIEEEYKAALEAYQAAMEAYAAAMAAYNPNPPSSPPPEGWTPPPPPQPPVPPVPPTIPPMPQLNDTGVDEMLNSIVNSLNNLSHTANEIRDASDSLHKTIQTVWDGEKVAYDTIMVFDFIELMSRSSARVQTAIQNALRATEGQRKAIFSKQFGDTDIIKEDFSFVTFKGKDGQTHRLFLDEYLLYNQGTTMDKANMSMKLTEVAREYGPEALYAISLLAGISPDVYEMIAKNANVRAYSTYEKDIEHPFEALERTEGRFGISGPANITVKWGSNPNYTGDEEDLKTFLEFYAQLAEATDADISEIIANLDNPSYFQNFTYLKGQTLHLTPEQWSTIYNELLRSIDFKYDYGAPAKPGQNRGTDCSGLVSLMVNLGLVELLGDLPYDDACRQDSDYWGSGTFGVPLTDIDWNDPQSFNNIPVGTVLHWDNHVAIVTAPGEIMEQYDYDNKGPGRCISIASKIKYNEQTHQSTNKPDAANALFDVS